METKTLEVTGTKIDIVEYWKARAKQAEQRVESFEFVMSYAQDLIKMWPTVTLRTLHTVTTKIAGLKEAIALVEK